MSYDGLLRLLSGKLNSTVDEQEDPPRRGLLRLLSGEERGVRREQELLVLCEESIGLGVRNCGHGRTDRRVSIAATDRRFELETAPRRYPRAHSTYSGHAKAIRASRQMSELFEGVGVNDKLESGLNRTAELVIECVERSSLTGWKVVRPSDGVRSPIF